MGRVALEHVSKRFDDVAAVDDLSLDVADEEFLVLLGPSGCGKSTALRMIAGLEDPTAGTITIGDRVVNDVEAKDRDIAMVFQSYALYPHMTVRRNIEFPLRSREGARATERAAVGGRTRPRASGSRRCSTASRRSSRVANASASRSARAIVRRPQAFLMDEPLSNLDAKLRRADPRRAGGAAAAPGRDRRVRDPRPGRGDDDGPPDRGARPRRAPAGRRTAGRLRPAGQPVRGPVHRQPADEHRHRPRRPDRRRARGRDPGRPHPARARAGERGRARRAATRW